MVRGCRVISNYNGIPVVRGAQEIATRILCVSSSVSVDARTARWLEIPISLVIVEKAQILVPETIKETEKDCL